MWHLYNLLEERVIRIARENSKFPANSIVAFSIGGDKKCPENWMEVSELRGKFIIGAEPDSTPDGAHYGVPGGAKTARLTEANLPPHRHQVYRHAGEVIGSTSGVSGAGGGDINNPTSNVREKFIGRRIRQIRTIQDNATVLASGVLPSN
jgi:hypothetical protein